MSLPGVIENLFSSAQEQTSTIGECAEAQGIPEAAPDAHRPCWKNLLPKPILNDEVGGSEHLCIASNFNHPSPGRAGSVASDVRHSNQRNAVIRPWKSRGLEPREERCG